MRVVLVSRYPRVDTPEWKRRVAQGLLEQGVDLGVLYSRSSVLDHARAGIREFGADALHSYVAVRRGQGQTERDKAEPSLATSAAAREIPVRRVDTLRNRQAAEAVRALAPDLVLLVGSDLVPGELLRIAPRGTINAHYGLLPAYRGMNVTEWSILEGAPPGVTSTASTPGSTPGKSCGGRPSASLQAKRLRRCA